MQRTRALLDAADAAYPQVWEAFLRNRHRSAEQKGAAMLQALALVPEAEKDADAHVTEADFAYIVGAVRGNDEAMLLHALGAYDRCLSCSVGTSVSARRMRAETLMRLARYPEAFGAFAELGTLRAAGAWQAVELPPFRLRHDANLVERLAASGRIDAEQAAAITASLRSLAQRVEDTATSDRPQVAELAAADRSELEEIAFDELWSISPYPPERLSGWAGPDAPPVLGEAVDWARVEEEYLQHGVTIVDGLLSPQALAELWAYSLEAPTFRTVRAGFLGAFPGDGFAHPIVYRLAQELLGRMPRVLGGHPLGLYWLFKYTDEGPRGIGIHADAAAVNFNIWLTPDCGRRSGGGLDIFTQVPPEEAAVQDFNQEFATVEAELEFRKQLEAGGMQHVEYRRNRAAIFVSDLFHVSEPFDFPDSVDMPRVNLTLLFGDRSAARRARPQDEQGSSGAQQVLAPDAALAVSDAGDARKASITDAEDGWDLFD